MITAVASRLIPESYNEYGDLSRSIAYGVNLHPLWLAAYIRAFGVETPVFLEARDEATGALHGYLPLIRKDSRETRLITQRRYVPAGYGPTDFFGIPATAGVEVDVGRALGEWFIGQGRSWDHLMLDLIPHHSPTPFVLARHLVEAGYAVQVTSEHNYLTLDTTGSYESYLNRLGPQKLKEIRYNRGRLLKRGRSLEVSHLSDGGDRHLDDFISLYAKRRSSKCQSDPYARQQQLREFMKTVIPLYEERGWITLSLLMLDDVAVAYCYSLTYNGVLYYYSPTFREEFGDCSPGKLLLFELIRRAFELPAIREFNFMRSEYGYKRWFEPEVSPYFTITADNLRSPRTRALRAIATWNSWRAEGGARRA